MLFGRTGEMERIGRVIDGARHTQGATLVIRGAAGIGKSALLDAAAREAGDMLLLRSRGVDLESELPFSGLFDVFRPIFDLIDQIPAAQRLALRSALGLGEPRSVERFAISTGTLALLSAAAEQRPVLVIVDDAQWLDSASSEALLFAAHRLHRDGVAFLAAVRSGTRRGRLFAEFDEVELTGLDESSAHQVVAEALRRDVAPSVLRYLVEATNGNPLTLIEAVRALGDQHLSGETPIPQTLPLGASALEIFRRRIDGLDGDAVCALALLAVDSTKDAPVLRRAAEVLGIDYRSALELLERQSLVRIDFGRPELTHPLVRGAVESTVEPGVLRSAHRALADVLAGRPDPTAWAWHLAAAATEPGEAVAGALEEAALAAENRSAYASAAVAYERSAGFTFDETVRVNRLLSGAEAARHAGRTQDARRLLAQATTHAGSARLRARVECEQARGELYHGGARTAGRLLETAAARVRDEDPRQAATILGQAAFAAMLTGDAVRAGALAYAARDLVAGEARGEPIVELTLGLALLHHGDVANSLAVLRAAADLTERLRDEIDPDFLSFAALALTWVGDFDRARQIIAGLVPRARDETAFGLLCSALYAAAYLEARTGHLISAYALATEGIDVAEATSNNLWRYLSLCCLAYVEAAQVREEDCRRHAEEASRLARELEFAYQPTVLDALGLLELALDRPEQAITYLEPANVRAGGSEPTFGRPSAPDLVEAYVRAHRPVPAAMAAQMAAISADERYPSAAAVAARCCGLAASAPDIDHHFAAALRLHAQVSNPFAQARTEMCYGERLLKAGRRVDARPHLRRAHTMFEELGATHWAGRAGREIRDAGGQVGPVPTGGLSALTPQELQVAMTVAKGVTNREAGAILYVSPKTVEFHLNHIFVKLGIRSRAGLAALMASSVN